MHVASSRNETHAALVHKAVEEPDGENDGDSEGESEQEGRMGLLAPGRSRLTADCECRDVRALVVWW